MKKIIGLVIILVALILGLYYGMGYFTEKKIKESIRLLNRSNGLSTEIVRYQRRWFTSTAVFNWRLHIPEQIVQNNGQTKTIPAQDYRMEMPVTIYHGPIMIYDKELKFGVGFAHTVLNLPAEYMQQFDASFTNESVKPNLVIDFFVTYFGNSHIDMTVPPFNLFAKEGNMSVAWLGMSSATTISSDLDTIDGDIKINGLNLKKDQINTKVAAITSNYTLYRGYKGLFIGHADLSFPSLVVMNGDRQQFMLSKLDVDTKSSIEKQLFDFGLKSSVDKIVVQDKVYGPGTLDVAISNLDADILAKINQQVTSVQQGTDLTRQRVILSILPELPQLFSKGATLEIKKLNFVLPLGTIDANLKISLPKGNAARPFELIQKMQGNGKLRVPVAVVQELVTESIKQKMLSPKEIKTDGDGAKTDGTNVVQQLQQPQATDVRAQAAVDAADVAQQAVVLANKQLDALVKNGVLVQNGKDYEITVNLNAGELLINGKPYSSEMMKF